MSSKYDIPSESFTAVSVSENTELIFTLKPVGGALPPPYDISSMAYRIEASV